MCEVIYEELLNDHISSRNSFPGVHTHHTPSMDDTIFLQHPVSTPPRRYQEDVMNGKAKDHRRSKVIFPDDTHLIGSGDDFADYVTMDGSGLHASSVDVTVLEDEYVEMTSPQNWSQKKQRSVKSADSILKGKAIMRLAVYVNAGMVTIHVRHARHLQSELSPICSAYVKVSITPEDNELPGCYTEVIKDTNHPVYEEKFSFELLEEDFGKRILISVWNYGQNHSDPEFLGGMSFGLWHIYTRKRTVDGWYYLLHEDIAQRKHVQAVGRKQELSQGEVGKCDAAKRSDVTVMADNDTLYATIQTPSCLKDPSKQNNRHRSVRFREPLQTSTPHNHNHVTSNLDRSNGDRTDKLSRQFVDGVTEACVIGRQETSCDTHNLMTSSKVIRNTISQCVTESLPVAQLLLCDTKCSRETSYTCRCDTAPIPEKINPAAKSSTGHVAATITHTETDPTVCSNHSADHEHVYHETNHSSTTSENRDPLYETLDNSEKAYIQAVAKACRKFVFNCANHVPQVCNVRRFTRCEQTRFAAIRQLNALSIPRPIALQRSRSCLEEGTYENIHIARLRPGKQRSRSFSRSRSVDSSKENVTEKAELCGQKRKHDNLNTTDASCKQLTEQQVKRRRTLVPSVLTPNRDWRIRHGNQATVINRCASWRQSIRRALRPRTSKNKSNDGVTGISQEDEQGHTGPGVGKDTQGGVVSSTKKHGFVDKIKGLKFVIPRNVSFRAKKHS